MESFSSSFPYAPLWVLALVFFASLILARELGAFVRARQGPREDGERCMAIST